MITKKCQKNLVENIYKFQCFYKNNFYYSSSILIIMKIILIAPGFTSLPPIGWGAVESVVHWETAGTHP